MNSGKFHATFLKSLRVLYRLVPMPDARKLLWIDWLTRFGPLQGVAAAARQQVALELAAQRLENPDSELEESGSHCLPSLFAQRPHAGTRAIGYVEHFPEPMADSLPAKIIAFYLPQFHPIAENDKAWGRGFTEWNNVTRALPQVEGQVQPRLPGELGFYDLRIPSIQERQVELARHYGIAGFCFHFYWFGGKRLLELPLAQYLENTNCDLPFCLCWANENWTRRWDGHESEVLVAQQHSASDDLDFIAYVARYLRDPRYIRLNGKPLLLVYRPALLPEPRETARRWRDYCREAGIGEIYLASTMSFERQHPSDLGFDALVEFAPNNTSPELITHLVRKQSPDFSGNVYDWRSLVQRSRRYVRPPYRLFRGVNPGWDNTPRKPVAGNVFLHASPRGFEEWMLNAIRDTVKAAEDRDHRLVFLNAWNEWAEGAYMEPDARLGYAYLAANRRAVQRVADEFAGTARARDAEVSICVVVHAFYPELLDEILDRLGGWRVPTRLIITTTAEREAEVRERLLTHGVDADCRVFENRGRDILPFLHVANELADAGEGLVVKLHTKRSPHRVDGDTWRLDLLDKLIAPDNAARILAAFREHPELGMVAPEGHILPMPFYWGSNEANVHYLCRLMGIAEVDPANEVFPAGSMFWARVDALRPLLDTHLDETEFEAERGQLDGTMPHAIERILALSVREAGLYLASTASPETTAMALDAEYGFAESSRGAVAPRSGQ